MSTSDTKYAIIDVETTGGNARTGRITEIAIAVHDGKRIINTFESLVNPEISIPPFIRHLTGITNEMVADAPYFYEVARQVVEITEDCIFVAHNVKFDYMFIRSEFERLGYSYQRRQLCTRQLTKKFFPQIGRYSLDRLIEYFDIRTEIRHRAMADVKATIEVFEHLLRADQGKNLFTTHINHGVKLSKLPGTITIEDIHAIPETAGVYYFFGANDHLLYVGRSKNIQKRVMQHFSNPTTRSIKFLERTRRIDYEETGSEITSILREDEIIKSLRPEYNVAQRKTLKPYGLRICPEDGDLFQMEFLPIRDNDEDLVKTFKSRRSAQSFLRSVLEEFQLDELLTIKKNGNGFYTDFQGTDLNPDLWAESFRRLWDILHERRRFHHAVIDHSYSHHEATCFLFEQGRLTRMIRIDTLEAFTDLNPDDMEICRPPLAINDRIIAFIQKHRKRYKIMDLS